MSITNICSAHDLFADQQKKTKGKVALNLELLIKWKREN